MSIRISRLWKRSSSRSRPSGPEEIWCLGDVVGYGAQPDECTALVRERCAVSLNGNHDLAVTGGDRRLDLLGDGAGGGRLDPGRPRRRRWSSSPGSRRRAPATGFGLFHASPRDPIWEYVLSIDQAEAGLDAQTERICLIGHSHVSLFFTRPPSTGRKTYATGAQSTDGDLLDLAEGEWLLNPGSVGQPRDGDPRAAWLEIDTDEWTARYHRVPYDAVAAGAAILEAGLPTALAERLQIGR